MDLRMYRNRANLSQGMVSTRCGITNAYYSQIENGLRSPSVEVAKKIAAVLDFDWTLFYEDQEDKSDEAIRNDN